MNRFLDGLPILEESHFDGVDLSRNQNHIIRNGLPNFFEVDSRNYRSDLVLKTSLSRIHKKKVSQIVIGNGSTDILNVCARASLCPGKTAHFKLPSYAPIKIIIEKTGAKVSEEFGDVLFVVNPNNPTGEFTDPDSIDYNRYDLVIVDEAYMEYHPEKKSFMDEVDKRTNLVVTRTFSKFYGFAGLRIGYLVASKEIAEYLQKIQNPYPISSFSINAAIYAIHDIEYSTITMRETRKILRFLVDGLDKLGVERLSPCGNFVSARIPKVKGFQTRNLDFYSGLKGWERISCSTEENIRSFLFELEKTL